jgi:hypothetical protein
MGLFRGVAESGPARRGWLLPAVAPPLLAGAWLRFSHLGGQVLGGDELHAVRAALDQPLAAILTTYQLTDSCIPLTAFDRLLVEQGVALSERVLRLPMLVCGLLALPLLAWMMRGRVASRTRILWLWLLALSPLLVLYSRIARSYMPMVLLACAAAVAFERWWHGATGGGDRESGGSGAEIGAAGEGIGRRGHGGGGAAAAYVALGALAVWFHLGAAPFVGAPLLFALGDLAGTRGQRAVGENGAWQSTWRRRGGRGAVAKGGATGPPDGGVTGESVTGERRQALGRLGLAGAGLLGACALFLLPARESLLRLIAGKHQAQSIPAATWGSVLRLQAGTAAPPAAVVFWLAAAAGLVLLLRRRRRFALFTLTLAAVQLLGILALSPIGLANALVLDRYLLPLLPIVLLWVAEALAHPWWPRPGRLGRAGQGLAAAGFLAALLAAGPFADAEVRASSFMHHNDLVAFARPRAALPRGELPLPYRALGGGAVVELPWPPVWDFGRSFYVYQEVHGLPVLVAPPRALLDDPRLRLRNWVAAAPEAIGRSGARWAIVHLRLDVEEDRLRGTPLRTMPERQRLLYAREGRRMAALLAGTWGPPTFSDPARGVLAWDLSRLSRVPAVGEGGRAKAR